ncbi:hypothetical protein PVL29_026731 [Vitis rotundifolia]|uniref:BHLH domain-containing protein n=1 Tax=Vitis rotundifolia TaxID=103349 RepID=A0AA38YH62_VITRO|nr:hypothetical protein PVL29_026731 [Vitis rotundifolia]
MNVSLLAFLLIIKSCLIFHVKYYIFFVIEVMSQFNVQFVRPCNWLQEYGPMQSRGDSLDEFDFESFSSENFFSYPSSCPKTSNPYWSNSTIENFQAGVEKPATQLKTNRTFYGNLNWNGKPKDRAASIGNMNLESLISQDSYQNQDYSQTYGQETKRLGLPRNPIQNQEHVIAERKRREKVNLLFIALSAIVPGLTKTDKASVLGDAVKYLKHLQERVKMLEEQTAKKMVESVVTVKRYQLSDNETSSSYHNSDSSSNQPFLEIEARVSNQDVLIRIHCQKQKGFAVKILGEIEKLHLTVIKSSFLPFGEYIMDITIVAQMDHGFCTTAKDLVRNLRLAVL